MAISMTRAEYQAKYGTPPPVANSPAPAQSAPIRMTREQYQQKYGTQPGQTAPAQQPEKPGFFQGVAQDIARPFLKGVSSVAAAANNTVAAGAYALGNKEYGDTVRKNAERITKEGENYGPLGKVRPIGADFNIKDSKTYGGAVADAVGTGAEVASYLIPAGQATKGAGTIAKKGLGTLVKEGIKTGIKEGAVIGATQGFGNSLQQENKNRGLQNTILETTVGAGVGALGGAIVGGASPVVSKGLSKVAEPIQKRIFPTAEESVNKIVSKRENEIFNIENNYAKTRKAQGLSNDAGAGSRKRVASTDVLVGSVDENGLIRTKQPGGAVEQYRKQTIDGAEDVVLKGLEKEGASTKLNDVRSYLERNIDESNLTMDEKEAAQNTIERTIAGFQRKYPDGNIPLAELQREKIRTTQNIDYTNTSSRIRQKAVGNAYKKIIEDKSSMPIKPINGELQKYYQDLDLLENLDGKRVKGGKLGTYFAKLGGQVAGGVVGNTIGGPLGGFAGTVVGGEVAERLKGRSLSGSFGKATGNLAPKSEILEKAVQANSTPRLALPAPEKGAPRTSIKSSEPITLLPKDFKGEYVGPTQSKSPQDFLRKNTITPPNKIPSNASNIPETLPQSTPKVNSTRGPLGRLYDNITGKDIPNKQGGFVKIPKIVVDARKPILEEIASKLDDAIYELEGGKNLDKIINGQEKLEILKSYRNLSTKEWENMSSEQFRELSETMKLAGFDVSKKQNPLGKNIINAQPRDALGRYAGSTPATSKGLKALGETPKELESLAQEARKYKTAEEFIDSLRLTDKSNPNKTISGLKVDIGVENLGGNNLFKSPGSKTNPFAVQAWENKIKNGDRPVIYVNSEYPRLVDGNNRLEAYKNLGFLKVPVVTSSSLIDFYKKVMGR